MAARARAERGELAVRHRRHVADLALTTGGKRTSPTSATPAARCCSTSTRAVGRRAAAAARRAARDAARGARLERGLRQHDPAVRRDGADRRDGRRPAGGAVRPGLLRAGHGEEHLRHRLLHAAQHRHDAGAVEARPADDRRLARDGRTTYALEGSVFIAGAAVQWLRDGLERHRLAGESRRSRRRCPTATASTSCRRSSASARRTGTRRARRDLSASRATPARRIARAALEAMAYQTRDVLDAMARDAGTAASGAGRRRHGAQRLD